MSGILDPRILPFRSCGKKLGQRHWSNISNNVHGGAATGLIMGIPLGISEIMIDRGLLGLFTGLFTPNWFLKL
jgi:hypothetical protein